MCKIIDLLLAVDADADDENDTDKPNFKRNIYLRLKKINDVAHEI